MVLKQKNPTPVYQYLMLNRMQFSTDQQSPVIAEDMPENSYSAAIVTKMEGNLRRFTYSWLLVDPSILGYTSIVYDGNNNPLSVTFSDGTTGNVVTPQQQYDFLMNVIENKSINNQYNLTMYDTFPSALTAPKFSIDGIIEGLTIDQGEGDAANYKATLKFVAGTVITVTSS